MEDSRELLAHELAKITENATSNSALLEDEKKRLDQQTKEIEEFNASLESTVKAVTESDSKLSQLATNRTKLMEEIRETRQRCYLIGQDIEVLNTTYQDCQSLCHKIINNDLAPNCNTTENMLEQLEKLLNEEYENEKRKILGLEEHYKIEIATREKQLAEIENYIRRLEIENLDEKRLVLERIVEENMVKLKEMLEEEKKLFCEVDEKRAVLKKELAEIAEEEKCLDERLEEIRKEDCQFLEEITLYKEELKNLQEKDTALLAEIETEKEEEQNLQASLESVQAENNTLKLIEKVAEFRIKQTLETNCLFGFKYDNSLTEEQNLEQCKIFLSKEIGSLKEQKEEYEVSTKTHEQKINEILEQKQSQIQQTNEAELQIEKLKSERIVLELEYNEIHLGSKHETEKQNKEINILKEQVNAKAKQLENLNDEIKQIETDYYGEQNEFCEKHSELDQAVERLGAEKKTVIQQLSEATENLKKLQKECDNLSYYIVKLENKKAQLIAPEKEAAAVRFKKPRMLDENSESSVEAQPMSALRKIYKKMKVDKSKKK